MNDEREVVYAACMDWRDDRIEVASARVVKRTEKTVTIEKTSRPFGFKTRLMPSDVSPTAASAAEAERIRIRAEIDTMRRRIAELEAVIAEDYVMVKP